MLITDEVIKKAVEEAVLRAYWAIRTGQAEAYRVPKADIMTKTGPHVIKWDESVRAKFIEWLEAEDLSEDYVKDCVRYLDKYMRPIRSPADVVSMFAACKRGRQHLDRGFRRLLAFYRKIMGFPKAFIEDLKEAIPTIRTGRDTYVPTEEAVITTLRFLKRGPFKYYLFYWVPLATGIRVKKDAIRLITEANLSKAERIETPHGAYYFLKLNWVSRTKAAFVACLPDFVYEMIMKFRESGEKLTYNAVRCFRARLRRKGISIEEPNSMRDFCYNKLLELGMPESAADFLNGRGPRTIGGQHYMEMERQIKAYYPKYLAYLKKLEAKLKR